MAALNTALSSIAEDIDATTPGSDGILDGTRSHWPPCCLPAGAPGDRIRQRGVMIAGLMLFPVRPLLAIFVDGPA